MKGEKSKAGFDLWILVEAGRKQLVLSALVSRFWKISNSREHACGFSLTDRSFCLYQASTILLKKMIDLSRLLFGREILESRVFGAGVINRMLTNTRVPFSVLLKLPLTTQFPSNHFPILFQNVMFDFWIPSASS